VQLSSGAGEVTGELVISDLWVGYGDVVAVRGVSLSVAPGEIVALLGANGAGKSSILQAITGMVPSSRGTIHVGPTDLTRLLPEQRAPHVAHVPEGRRLFPRHTVRENLDLGAFGAHRNERSRRRHEVHELFPQLRELDGREAGLLSGGQQQMVALGRGLMSGAPALVIDELSLGLAPTVAGRFATSLRQLRDRGLAILLVEQYVNLAARTADRIVVIDRGEVVLAGEAAIVADDARAIQVAYLGSDNEN